MSMATTQDSSMSARTGGPDFVGVGAQKSGTTWVGDILSQHPQIMMRKKELSFFIHHFHKGYEWYHEWFRDRGDKIAGEISVNYMYAPRPDSTHKEFYPSWNPRRKLLFWREQPSVRDELASRYPDVKVFAVFRNPVERAYSHYWFWRNRRERNGKRIVPFETMFQDNGRWIRTQGEYAHHLAYWQEKFPNMGVYLHDDIKACPEKVAEQVYALVGVDAAFRPELTRKPNKGRYEPMGAETRALLIEAYREQVERFGEMVGRDLSHWLAEK